MQFYKYLYKQYRQQFRYRGTIAIGNIELFRDIEKKEIFDEFEGRTVYCIYTGDEPVELSVEQANAITNDYCIKKKVQIGSHSFFKDSLKVPNAFAFCLSSKLDPQLIASFGYDSFYTIVDVNAFMNTIYAELNKRHQLLYSIAESVRYVQTKTFHITNANKDTVIRTSPYNSTKSDQVKTIYIEDYFTKPDQFQHESEYRLVFVPARPIPKDLILLNCKELLRFCEF